ncbi:hypothetical protein M514_00765 [Trichuris suis]|uniref:CID domain-containing protein n=1 Tax=Trichuris suis TaxID=68888 RepID=A0A085N9E0_9BILA|nr:hypothetical protein M514_00765 [Trichuris suis]
MALTEEDVIADYRSSLLDLQFNSKPHINMLTMLAEESQQFAPQIVEVIEAHVHEVPPSQKLPVLYLIDSIVKNCPESPYKDLFAKNLINTFVHVFDKVDEKTRQSLFKLRQTWLDIFPASRLYRIDIKVHEIDPAWPLQEPSQLRTAQNTNAVLKNVHFNPRFMEQKPIPEAISDKGAAQPVMPNLTAEQMRHNELLRLQKELEMERRSMLGKQGDVPGGEKDMRRAGSVTSDKIGQRPSPAPSVGVATDPRIRKRQIESANMRMLEGTLDGPTESMSWGSGNANQSKVANANAVSAGDYSIDELGDRDHWKTDREPSLRRGDRDYRSSRSDRRSSYRGSRRSRESDLPRFKTSPPRPSRDRSPHRNYGSPSHKRHRRYSDEQYVDDRIGGAEYDQFEKQDVHCQRRSRFDVYPENMRENQVPPAFPSFREELPADQKMDVVLPELHDPRLKTKRPFVSTSRSRIGGYHVWLCLEKLEIPQSAVKALQFSAQLRLCAFSRSYRRKEFDGFKVHHFQECNGFILRFSLQPIAEDAKKSDGLEKLANDGIVATSTTVTTTTMAMIGGESASLPAAMRISIDAPVLPTSSADSIFEHRASIFQRAEQQLSDGLITSGEYNDLMRDIGHVVGDAGLNATGSGGDYSVLPNEVKPPLIGHATTAGSSAGIVPSSSSSASLMDATLLSRKATTVEIVSDESSSTVPINNRLYVDGLAYEVRFIDEVAVIERNGLPHRIYFVGTPHDVVIDGIPHPLSFTDPRPIIIDGQSHTIRFGAPSRELYIGNFPLRASFGGPPIFVNINGVKHKIQLCGPPPEVKIDPEPAYELIRFMSSSHMAKRVAQDNALATESSRRAALLTPKQPVASQRAAAPPSTQTNVTELLEKLLKSGIIGQQVPLVPQAPMVPQAPLVPQAMVAPVQGPPPLSFAAGWNPEEVAERRQAPTSDLKTFNVSFLKIRYKSVIDSLHQHKIQCSTCGMRFPVDDNVKYAKHLDWHFKMNRREKSARGAVSRPWFLALEDVVNYEELGEDITTKVKSSVFEAIQKPSDKPLCGTVASTDSVAVASEGEQFCAVCEETFEQFFDQDEDAWKLRNATVVNGKTYHPLCYQDFAPAGVESPTKTDEQEKPQSSLSQSWIPSAVKSESIDVKVEDTSVNAGQPGFGERTTNVKENAATTLNSDSCSSSSSGSLLQSILSVFCKVPVSSSAAALASGNSATQSVLTSSNGGNQMPMQNCLSVGGKSADLASSLFPTFSGAECPRPSLVVTSSSFVAPTAQTISTSVPNVGVKQEQDACNGVPPAYSAD